MSDELWLPEGARTTNYGRPRTGVPSEAEDALRRGLKLGMAEDTGDRLTMAHNRRTASAARMGGGGVSMAIGRPRDPMFYWEQNNLPYKFDTREGLAKIREYSRAVYLTHPIIGSAVDIYCNWPLQGLELRCTDNALTDFYTDLFLDEDRLDYQEHLVDIGREYWVTGECFSLGSFNDSLGVWEDDELIDPDDVEVIVSPFLKEPRFEMRLPESIRTVLEKRNPVWEYEALLRSYPELRFFMSDDKARMPVSSILLRRLKFKAHNFSVRGLPILMRAFRTLMQEEMLNAAFDSVASRLYTPLILANIGASAQELGTSQPWIPSDGDIMDFQDRLDSALAADFRVLVSHFAVKMQNVFGREMLPRAGEDFDRIDGRLLQVFGISQSMLSGAEKGQTYAADALNFELVSQLLSRFQRLIKGFYRQRALVVAEAQGHYAYEVRGGRRYPVMEEILEVDEKGEQRIVERPKLLVPDISFRTMNMQSEQDQRQFVEALRAGGVPISMRTRLTNVPIDLDEERDLVQDEQVANAVAAQEVRRRTYEQLIAQRLPVPEDLQADFGPTALQGDQPTVDQIATPEEQVAPPALGTDEPADTEALVPVDDLLSDPEGEPSVDRLPRSKWLEDGGQSSRPAQSDERRDGMPRAASLTTAGQVLVPMERVLIDPAAQDDNGNLLTGAGSLQLGPAHIGRRAILDPDIPLDDQLASMGWQ